MTIDHKWLITGSHRGGMVKVWNMESGTLDRSWVAASLSPYPYMNENSPEFAIAALDISADGKILVTGGKSLKA